MPAQQDDGHKQQELVNDDTELNSKSKEELKEGEDSKEEVKSKEEMKSSHNQFPVSASRQSQVSIKQQKQDPNDYVDIRENTSEPRRENPSEPNM